MSGLVARRDHGPYLQWGRDLTVADSRRRLVASQIPTLICLQWGRDLTVADRPSKDATVRLFKVLADSFNGAAT